jgi:CDP-6-deoxy-D-xylo-4-hexulose-3-dehydrase
MINVSYAKTIYGQKEIDAVVKCLKEGTQMGKYSREFEEKIAIFFTKKYGIYVNSGSSALYIAMEAFNFKPGSEVITPALTFSTTVGAIVKNNLIPAFVDVGEANYCIDVSKIEEMITTKTVAILAPNLLGNLCQWDKIKEIALKYNLKILEDSADTLGATLHGKSSGYWADISITSFYGSHIINCAGNGGALCVNDLEYLRKAKLLRSWGRSSSVFDEKSEAIENRFNLEIEGIKYDAKFVFEMVGYNLEGSEIGAAFGLKQLEDLNENITIRRQNYQIQYNFFKNYPHLFTLPDETKGAVTGWLAFPLIIKADAGFERQDLQIFLEKRNIQTRVVFTGNITRQPGFRDLEMKKSSAGYQNSDNIMRFGILLACHHGLNQEMIDHMHNSIDEFIINLN